MALAPGTRLGHYDVTAQLGAGGGMGEVYRAIARIAAAIALLVATDIRPGLVAQSTSIPVSGTVRADDSSTALSDVRVLAPDGSRVLSDANGEFHLTLNSPARLTVLKAGFVSQVVPVGSGQRAPVDIRLVRSSSIVGRVLDERGEPVIGVVVALRTLQQSGSASTARAETDDLGDYRIGGLAPGRYIAVLRTAGQTVRFGTPNGGIGAAPSIHTFYYPNTERDDAAQPISVAAGEERGDIDFFVPAQAAARQVFSALGQIGVGGFPRSTPRPTQFGGIRGIVVDERGRGLAQAQVVVVQSTGPVEPLMLQTDNAGRFSAPGILVGRYDVLASKAGYFPSQWNAPGRGAVEVSDQAVSDTQVRLTPWSVITGRVDDDLGEPLAGAQIMLLQVRYEYGRRLLRAVARPVSTDDTGSYRLYGVRPGTYLVAANIGDVTSTDVPGYSLTLFPSADVPAQGQFLTVAEGTTAQGINITMQRGRTARVSGRILGPDGQPTTGGNVALIPSQRSGAPYGLRFGATVRNDGNIEFRNVPPGDYVIQAYRGRSGPAREGDFGALPVSVTSGDIADLTVQMSTGTSVQGRIVLDTTNPSPSFDPAAFRITAVPLDFDASPQDNWAESGATSERSFELHGLSGTRRLEVVQVPSGWAFKELRLNGLDITDRPLRMNASVADLEVVLTDRVSVLSGAVGDDRSQPVASTPVLAFSTDRDHWYWSSRFIRLATTTAEGAYSVQGLPYGSYYVVAPGELPRDGGDAWQDPEYLDSVSRTATTVTVRDGERTTLDVRR